MRSASQTESKQTITLIESTMSLKFISSPAVVAGAGAAILVGLPFLETALATTSLAVLKGVNATSFLVNTISVSVPGRIDEAQDQAMRQGALNPSKPTGEAAAATDETPLVGTLYSSARTRSIVSPAGWAFAIWVRKVSLKTSHLCVLYFSVTLLPSATLYVHVLGSNLSWRSCLCWSPDLFQQCRVGNNCTTGDSTFCCCKSLSESLVCLLSSQL